MDPTCWHTSFALFTALNIHTETKDCMSHGKTGLEDAWGCPQLAGRHCRGPSTLHSHWMWLGMVFQVSGDSLQLALGGNVTVCKLLV